MGVCNCSLFVVHYFMSILVLQSSLWGRESWLLYLICLTGVSCWLSGSSLRCQGLSAVCDCGFSYHTHLLFLKIYLLLALVAMLFSKGDPSDQFYTEGL